MQEFLALMDLLGMLVMDPRTGVLFALLLAASVIDCHTYKIPNWLTASGAAFGLLYALAVPFSASHGFLWALGGLALGLVAMLPFYALRVMGAGDVKLMAMAGAYLGVVDTFYAVLSTFIVGGIVALGFALFRGVTARMFNNIKNASYAMLLSVTGGVRPYVQLDAGTSVGKLPYGISIGIGTIGYVVVKQLGYL